MGLKKSLQQNWVEIYLNPNLKIGGWMVSFEGCTSRVGISYIFLCSPHAHILFFLKSNLTIFLFSNGEQRH